MLDKRTQDHSKLIHQVRTSNAQLKEEKQDKASFHDQRMEIQRELDTINKEIDKNENNIRKMEHFIDKYIPIRVQQQISESIKAILPQSQVQRWQNFEMEKFCRLNEDLIDDEEDREMLELMKKIAYDMMDILKKFAAIAKARGIKYKIAEPTHKDKYGVGFKEMSDADKLNETQSVSHLDGHASAVDLRTSQSFAQGNSLAKPSSRSGSRHQSVTHANRKSAIIEYSADNKSRASQRSKQIQEIIDHNPQKQSAGPGISDYDSSTEGREEDDDDDAPHMVARHKQQLLAWLTEADFSKDMQLQKIADHKFKLDVEEENALIDTEGILKICKVMCYKIGMTYKRMDILFNDLRDEFKQNTQTTLGGLRKDLAHVNEVI